MGYMPDALFVKIRHLESWGAKAGKVTRNNRQPAIVKREVTKRTDCLIMYCALRSGTQEACLKSQLHLWRL
jgi:hypothetical protein